MTPQNKAKNMTNIKDKNKIATKIKKILIKDYDLELSTNHIKIYLQALAEEKDINILAEKIYDIAITLEPEQPQE